MKNDQTEQPYQLNALDKYSTLLDTQFRIPGTNIRFGVDFILGLVPGAGDLLGFVFSAGLVLTMARYGVSGQVIAKMIGNIFLDATIGSIPIIGNIFDLFYKANRTNYNLLRKHYGEGAYQGSIWRVIVPLLIVLVLLFIFMIWLAYKIISFTWNLIV